MSSGQGKKGNGKRPKEAVDASPGGDRSEVGTASGGDEDRTQALGIWLEVGLARELFEQQRSYEVTFKHEVPMHGQPTWFPLDCEDVKDAYKAAVDGLDKRRTVLGLYRGGKCMGIRVQVTNSVS